MTVTKEAIAKLDRTLKSVLETKKIIQRVMGYHFLSRWTSHKGYPNIDGQNFSMVVICIFTRLYELFVVHYACQALVILQWGFRGSKI